MWIWTLNWNEIREDLLIGSCPMTGLDLDRIQHETGASAILSLQHDECLAHFGIDYEQHRVHGRLLGLEMARSPMRDFNPGEQRQRLPTAVHRLWDLIIDRHRVYVHCTAGMGRSALTALGYLTFIEGYTPDEAIRLLKSKRPAVIPSLEAYDCCRADLLNPRHDESNGRPGSLIVIGLLGSRRAARRVTGIVPRTRCSGPLFPFVWRKHASRIPLCFIRATWTTLCVCHLSTQC